MTLLTSPGNPRVKQLRGAFRGQARLSAGLAAIEGEHLVLEAIRSGLALKTIFLAEHMPPPRWLPRSVELITLPKDIFLSAVDTQTPQGIAALLVPPTHTLAEALVSPAPALLLIAAALQDPGNLGTLIRSAHAFAANAVLTTPGTVSPWNQKALRASAGSLFRLPVLGIKHTDLAGLRSRGIKLFAAVADDELDHAHALPIADVDLVQPCALMIGNEGGGLSGDLLALADAQITIPTPGRVESLNAAIAGSVLLYEAARQRGKKASRE